jgi:hypothetical protein
MRSFLIVALALASSTPLAQTAATEPDTDKVVRLTEELEKDPKSATASDARRWLIQWITDTPDYTVAICRTLGPIPGSDVPNSSELLVQNFFGNVSYQIRHRGEKDEAVLQQAGIESVLRAYQSLLAKDPKARIRYLDDLLVKQQQGRLKETVAPIIAKECSPEGK